MMKSFMGLLILFAIQAHAAEIVPGVEARTYRRISGQNAFCDKTLRPELTRMADGKSVLELSERMNFAWSNKTIKDDADGCHEFSKQTLTSDATISTLILDIHNLCAGGNSDGSERRTLIVNGKSIDLKVERLLPVGGGQWIPSTQVNSNYHCVWN